MTMQSNQSRKSRQPFSPRPAQIDLMGKIMEGNARAFLKPGRGKTSCCFFAFEMLKELGMVDTMLVLGPLRVVTTSWASELDKWEGLENITCSLIHGDIPGKMATPADVYLMNVEGLLSEQWRLTDKKEPNEAARQWLKSKGKVLLIVDESTLFKNPNTRRFATLRKYLPYINRKVILTGTPRPGTLADLFSQCYITDQGKDLGKFITHFRRSYMQPTWDGFGWEERPGSADEVAKKIAATTVMSDPEDKDMPTREHCLLAPLTEDLKKQYKELEREFILELENASIQAINSGVLYGKLRQFAQGAIFGDGGKLHEIHDLKLQLLENLLRELGGEPAFCLVAYTHDYDRISEYLGYDVPKIGAGVSARAGAELCDRFGRGEIPLLLGHPQSVARGIDGLQKSCSNVIWFAIDPSWEQTYQANLRVVRSGNTAGSVDIYRLMLNCSIEHALLKKIDAKEENEKNFLLGLRDIIVQEGC